MTVQNIMYVVWAATFIALVVTELLTTQNWFIWYAGGAGIALLANIGLSGSFGWLWGLLIFILSGSAMLIAWLTWIKIRNRELEQVDELDHIFKRVYILLMEIKEDHEGKILVGDVTYTAAAASPNRAITKGTHVKIIRFDGNKAIVEEVK